MTTKILCPTDFSAGSQRAMRVAVRMANETGAELVLVHAWYIPPTAYSLEAPFPPEAVQGIVDDSQRALETAVKEATLAGAQRVTSKLLNGGPPWTQICAELEDPAYGRCVVGTHGRTGLARVLLGSVAEQVVRHAPCSVLAVRPDSKLTPFHHALVPTDFSDSAAHALDLAATLVEPTGSITVLHVLEVPVAISGEPSLAGFARDLDRRASAALDREVQRGTRGVPVTARMRLGYAGVQTLAALDDDRSIDLVVMGSHGRTGIKRVLMGSVAEKVVRHAHCAVMVARKRA
jgi:nucleotide-binding universal stress UspA family protein